MSRLEEIQVPITKRTNKAGKPSAEKKETIEVDLERVAQTAQLVKAAMTTDDGNQSLRQTEEGKKPEQPIRKGRDEIIKERLAVKPIALQEPGVQPPTTRSSETEQEREDRDRRALGLWQASQTLQAVEYQIKGNAIMFNDASDKRDAVKAGLGLPRQQEITDFVKKVEHKRTWGETRQRHYPRNVFEPHEDDCTEAKEVFGKTWGSQFISTIRQNPLYIKLEKETQGEALYLPVVLPGKLDKNGKPKKQYLFNVGRDQTLVMPYFEDVALFLAMAAAKNVDAERILEALWADTTLCMYDICGTCPDGTQGCKWTHKRELNGCIEKYVKGSANASKRADKFKP